MIGTDPRGGHPPLDPPGQATLRGRRPEQLTGEPEDSADPAERWDVIPVLQRKLQTNIL
jgi:hypothetical protein